MPNMPAPAEAKPVFTKIAERVPAVIARHTLLGMNVMQCFGNGFVRPDIESDESPLTAAICDLCEAPLSASEFTIKPR